MIISLWTFSLRTLCLFWSPRSTAHCRGTRPWRSAKVEKSNLPGVSTLDSPMGLWLPRNLHNALKELGLEGDNKAHPQHQHHCLHQSPENTTIIITLTMPNFSDLNKLYLYFGEFQNPFSFWSNLEFLRDSCRSHASTSRRWTCSRSFPLWLPCWDLLDRWFFPTGEFLGGRDVG